MVPLLLCEHDYLKHDSTNSHKAYLSYDYETYAPPSTNGDGGLGFIGMQRCLDCDSSPVAQLASRAAAQGWATVFSLNEPDLPSSDAATSPSNAAQWYQTNINPLNIKKR